MTKPVPCPPAPDPLEEYAARFDDLFTRVAQRRGFREYLAGLLAPRDRNKTLTALAGPSGDRGAAPGRAAVAVLLSESRWDAGRVNARRLELLRADPATAPHGGGVLVIDDPGDRKDRVKTAHVGGQIWAGTARPATGWSPSPRCGPMSGSITRCTRCRTPRRGTSRRGRTTRNSAPSWRSARTWPSGRGEAGFAFRAVAADSAYGDQDKFPAELAEAGLPFVMALRPRPATWVRDADAHTPADAARALAWDGPDDPGDWQPVTRRSATGTPGPGGRPRPPWAGGADGVRRLVVATADPATLRTRSPVPGHRAARPGGPRKAGSPHRAAGVAEITRIYGIRNWIEQSYKQVKDELGWADFQVGSTSRSAATRRWSTAPSASAGTPGTMTIRHRTSLRPAARTRPRREGGSAPPSPAPAPSWPRACARYAPGFPPGSRCSAGRRLVDGAPATAAAGPDELGRGRLRPAPRYPN